MPDNQWEHTVLIGAPRGEEVTTRGEKGILKQEAWTIYLRVSPMNMRVGVTYWHK